MYIYNVYMYGMCVWMYLDVHVLVKAPRTAVVAMQGHPGPPALRIERVLVNGRPPWHTCVSRSAVPGGVLQSNVAEVAGLLCGRLLNAVKR